jgi:monoamine oxidase
MNIDADVVVIGAGAAGLYAAGLLSDAGRRIIVVEARDRTGGRILTLSEPALAAPLELGPEFVHGREPALAALMRTARAEILARDGTEWMLDGATPEPLPDDDAEVNAIVAAALETADDVSVETFLRAVEAAHPERRAAAAEVRARVEGFDAADPARAGMRAIAEEWFGEAGMGGTSGRPSRGYGPIVRVLERTLHPRRAGLLLGTLARRIAWRRGGVEVEVVREGIARALRARAVIVTVPIGVLQAPLGEPGAIAFDPPLPQPVRRAIDAIVMGPVLKVVLRFERPFWETLDGGRYRDATFFRTPRTPFPTVWTQLPVRVPLLTTWVGGPPAEALGRLRDDQIADRAVASVEQLFPQAMVRAELRHAYLHDWQRDPFARGAYSYLAAGGDGAREALGTPLEGALFFAGEALALRGYGGTVSGALQSAARAASQVLAALPAAVSS